MVGGGGVVGGEGEVVNRREEGGGRVDGSRGRGERQIALRS